MSGPGTGDPEMKSRRAKTMWPPRETSLNDQEKAADRYLLYQAMLDIRNLCQSRGLEPGTPWSGGGCSEEVV